MKNFLILLFLLYRNNKETTIGTLVHYRNDVLNIIDAFQST